MKIHALTLTLTSKSPDYRERVDRVCVVDCPGELQLARVRMRSRLSEQEVRRIIAAQMPRSERLAAADDVIDNGGSLDALRRQVQALHQRYVALAGAK